MGAKMPKCRSETHQTDNIKVILDWSAGGGADSVTPLVTIDKSWFRRYDPKSK